MRSKMLLLLVFMSGVAADQDELWTPDHPGTPILKNHPSISPGAGSECEGETLNSLWRVAQQGTLLLRMANVSDDLEEGELKIDELLEIVAESDDGIQ